MSLIDEVNKYQYIGLPFEAFGFPGPIKQRLVGSNDGLNWDTLKSYGFGWRDIDMIKIGDRYFICATDDCVYYTYDFETFTNVPVKSGYKMSWAPEWFKDTDGTIYMFYAGGNSTSTFFKMFYRSFDPNTLTWGNPIPVSFEDDNSSRIDANVHYINGKYYMWIANQQSHDVELYKADKINGVYHKINTNMHDRTIEAGFNRNEAPEMIKDGNKYYLYTDPWTDGVTDEHDRMLYRCESTDLVNWSTMEKCNCSFGMRHFTPFFKSSDNNSNNNTNNINNINLDTWNGNPSTFYSTNLGNFKAINDFIDTWNTASNTNDYLTPISIELDTTDYTDTNRNAYNQFLENAKKINSFLGSYIDMYRLTDFDYIYNDVSIPKNTEFNRVAINEYWTTLNNHLNFLIDQVQAF